jgi:hypothetical protein
MNDELRDEYEFDYLQARPNRFADAGVQIQWDFKAPSPLYGYCKLIAAEMVNQFGVSEEEAFDRINKAWRGRDFSPPFDLNVIWHETVSWWARSFHYGHDSYWWIADENKRETLGLRPLESVRYP